MRPIEKILILVGLTAALVAGGIFLPDIFSKTSNCGGNSAAKSDCGVIMADLRLASMDLGNSFNVYQLSHESRTNIALVANDHWILGAKILLQTNIKTGGSSNLIILACDTAFGNVPQPTIWNGYKKNPAHAVGYSDGSIGLISPADFKKLNLTGFIDASLLATNEIVKTEIGSTK